MGYLGGGHALGLSTLLGFQGAPQSRAYTKTILYGSATVGTMHVQDTVWTDEQIAMNDRTIRRIWDGNTRILAEFNGDVTAGNISGVTDPITSFQLNRRKITDSTFSTLANLPASVREFNDVSAERNVSYIYEILAKSETEISEPILSEIVVSNYYNHILIDPSSALAFIFDSESRHSGYSVVDDHSRHDGYNKYSGHTFGDRDFTTGTVTAIVSDEDDICERNNLVQTIGYLDQIRAFISNGNKKILKDRKGRITTIITFGYNQSIWINEDGNQLYKVSFSFEEVAPEEVL